VPPVPLPGDVVRDARGDHLGNSRHGFSSPPRLLHRATTWMVPPVADSGRSAEGQPAAERAASQPAAPGAGDQPPTDTVSRHPHLLR